MSYDTETQKIDNATTDGLAGVNNSLAYRVHEIEQHFHSPEDWLGAAAAPSGATHVADVDSMTPFTLTSGSGTWGAWVQVIGSSDTPVRAGMVKFDPHMIVVSNVSADANKEITRYQIAFGASGAAAFAAGDYTDGLAVPEKDGKASPLVIQSPRITTGTKGWARCQIDGSDGDETNDIFIGLHEYPG